MGGPSNATSNATSEATSNATSNATCNSTTGRVEGKAEALSVRGPGWGVNGYGTLLVLVIKHVSLLTLSRAEDKAEARAGSCHVPHAPALHCTCNM